MNERDELITEEQRLNGVENHNEIHKRAIARNKDQMLKFRQRQAQEIDLNLLPEHLKPLAKGINDKNKEIIAVKTQSKIDEMKIDIEKQKKSLGTCLEGNIEIIQRNIILIQNNIIYELEKKGRLARVDQTDYRPKSHGISSRYSNAGRGKTSLIKSEDAEEFVKQNGFAVTKGKINQPISTLNPDQKSRACDCGARHSMFPSVHMQWCKLKRFK